MTRKTRSLLLLAPLLVSVFVSCDEQPKTKPAESADAKKAKKKSLGSPDLRFAEERSDMINGKFAEAADSLAETTTIPKIRQPLLSWIEFHQGMALMLAGKQDEARAIFGRMEDRGPFTKNGSDAQVAEFFFKLAHLLRGAEAVPAGESKEYDKWSYEGIAFLALALKDWNLDKYEDATAFFRQFNDVAPEKLVEWADGPEDLRKLKEISTNYVNDYTEFAPARKALDDVAGKPLEEQRDAVDQAKTARSHMKMNTKLSQSLDETLAGLVPKVVAVMEEKAKANAEEMAADNKALTDAKQKRADFLSKFQFAEAKAAIADPALKGEKERDEQALLTKKAAWLSNFKDQLIEDLNKKGYNMPITRKSGEALPGGISSADAQQVMMGPKAGAVPVPWSDVSLDSAYTMGLSFIQPDMPPEIAGFRKWHLGVFAFFAGKTKEGLDLMRAAAELRPVFKDELPVFENASGPY